MATQLPLPKPEEVSGPYLTQYEVYYRRLDPEGRNRIEALDAATFLKQSSLSDDILGKIWDVADQRGEGFLDRTGFFAACKLVALVQDKQDLMACNLKNKCPAPNFGSATAPGAPIASDETENNSKKKQNMLNFLVKPEEKQKYDALFDQLQPQDEKLPGQKVQQVMMASKLPTATLGKIWDLADTDKDGMLTRYEFTVAMHLVYRTLQGDAVPSKLPNELSFASVPQSLSAKPNLSVSKPQSTDAPSNAAALVEAVPWVVNAGDRLRYQALFRQTDTDKDGFVSGVEIKNVFLQTNLAPNILAHIWNLCDIRQEGKLNPEQFALAMWLIQRKQAGKEPPAALTPDMVPPSMRPKDEGASSIYSNAELEGLAKEIEALLSEKLSLEKDLQSLEYNVKVKESEGSSLESEFATLDATLKQLSAQKEAAQRKLDDLDSQRLELATESTALDAQLEQDMTQILKLRTQAEEQEATLASQEEDLNSKKSELESLRKDEIELRAELKKSEMETNRIEQELKIAEELNEETLERLEDLQLALSHIEKSLDAFSSANDDYSNLDDKFLEPLRITHELPDYSRLDSLKIVEASKDEGGSSEFADDNNNNAFANAFNNEGNGNVEWATNDAFAAFDQNNQNFGSFDPFGGNGMIGTTNISGDNFNRGKFGGDQHDLFSNALLSSNQPVAPPRPPDASPTPVLPPKSGPPSRPPPPRRPPPPSSSAKGTLAGSAAPPVPPPPKTPVNNDEDLFGDSSTTPAASGGSGFADFGAAKFDSFDDEPWLGNFDSAFNSTMKNLRPKSEPQHLFTNSGVSQDSVFHSATATPIPPFSQQSVDFPSDPFANSCVRYADPFDMTSDDPFNSKANLDPFTAPVAFDTDNNFDAFGNSNGPNNNDVSKEHFDPFGTPMSKTTTSRLKVKLDAFGSANDPFANISVKLGSKDSKAKNNVGSKGDRDPFGSDPFAPSTSKMSLTESPSPKKSSSGKKKHKWVPHFKHTNSGKSNTSESNVNRVDLKRAERERRMRLQEEQDLAYVIALSKAEAESLKTQ